MARQHKHIRKYSPGMYALGAAILLALVLLACLALWPVNPEVMLEQTDASADVAIAYHEKDQAILLQLSSALKDLPIAGSITLRHPSDQTHDLLLPLKPRSNMRQQIKVAQLQTGPWKVGVFFTAGDETYYSEKTIHIK